MNEPRPLVFVVDDDPVICTSLKRLSQSVGLAVETFMWARDFLQAKHAQVPSCVVLDVRLPGLSGLNLQEKLADAKIDLSIIFITGYCDIPTTVRAMKAGTLEFLTKSLKDQELLDAIQSGIEQDRTRLNERAEITKLQNLYDSLTPREQQVFPLVAQGRLNKQIAGELDPSEQTIKIHRGQVILKMKADSVADLVRMAEKLGGRVVFVMKLPNPKLRVSTLYNIQGHYCDHFRCQ